MFSRVSHRQANNEFKRSRSHSCESKISVLTENSVNDMRYNFNLKRDNRRSHSNGYNCFKYPSDRDRNQLKRSHPHNKFESKYSTSCMNSHCFSGSSCDCFRNFKRCDEDRDLSISSSKKQRHLKSDKDSHSVHCRQVSPSPSCSASQTGSDESLWNSSGQQCKGGFVDLAITRNKPCDDFSRSSKHSVSNKTQEYFTPSSMTNGTHSSGATPTSGPRFSDLPLEWWERGEGCKEAKGRHMDRVDNICYSREDLVLLTTLWDSDIVLEPNMFPCELTAFERLLFLLSDPFSFFQMRLHMAWSTTRCGVCLISPTTRFAS